MGSLDHIAHGATGYQRETTTGPLHSVDIAEFALPSAVTVSSTFNAFDPEGIFSSKRTFDTIGEISSGEEASALQISSNSLYVDHLGVHTLESDVEEEAEDTSSGYDTDEDVNDDDEEDDAVFDEEGTDGDSSYDEYASEDVDSDASMSEDAFNKGCYPLLPEEDFVVSGDMWVDATRQLKRAYDQRQFGGDERIRKRIKAAPSIHTDVYEGMHDVLTWKCCIDTVLSRKLHRGHITSSVPPTSYTG